MAAFAEGLGEDKKMTSAFADESRAALALMEQAIAILDRIDFAPEVGAQLDLAICRLREKLEPAGLGRLDDGSPALPDLQIHPRASGRGT